MSEMPSKVAIMTGAGRGIGAAIARSPACAGWTVARIDRAWPDGDMICAIGETLDVTDYPAIADFVAPDYIETEMTLAVPTQLREAEIARIPARRIGTPDDIAQTILFLASPPADFITGQVISVNGGQLMP